MKHLSHDINRRIRAVLAGLAALAGTVVAVAPAAHAATIPPVSLSRYVTTTDLYQAGCDEGKTADSQGQHTQVALLDFGDPGWQDYGAWGAWDTYIGGFNSNATIEGNVKRFMQGFWDCTVPGSRSFLYVAPGETNAGSGINSTADTATALGAAWGGMINDLNSWISAQHYTAQLAARGALDAEPGWGPPSYALAWAAGFMAASSASYYDFGSADGCPPYGSCDNGWSQASLYQLAWGNAPAGAIPQIYNNAQAREWAAISAWGSAHTSSGPIRWTAALSQYQACLDHGDSCAGADNTPSQSWQQLTAASGIAPIYATEMSYRAD